MDSRSSMKKSPKSRGQLLPFQRSRAMRTGSRASRPGPPGGPQRLLPQQQLRQPPPQPQQQPLQQQLQPLNLLHPLLGSSCSSSLPSSSSLLPSSSNFPLSSNSNLLPSNNNL